MILQALSIGESVSQADFDAVVHSAFRSALNLRLENNELLTLVLPDQPDLPNGIRVDAPADFSFVGFRIGERAARRGDTLRFASLTVGLSGAPKWISTLTALRFDSSDLSSLSAWQAVWRTLNARQRLARATIVADELLAPNEDKKTNAISRRAGTGMRALLDAARRFDPHAASSAASRLIGLGEGLTPSGDDLLAGFLAGLHCAVGEDARRAQFLSEFGELAIGLSRGTNDISRAYIYHAAQGRVSSRIAELAQALCRPEPPARLQSALAAALQLGHSSGMDAVTGLLCGLAAHRIESFFGGGFPQKK